MSAIQADAKIPAGVRQVCEVLQVSSSGYYAWRTRPESAREKRDRELMAEVRKNRIACQSVEPGSSANYGPINVEAADRADSGPPTSERNE